MTDFTTEIRQRVARTRANLAAALREGDEYLVSVLDGELESLGRLAADHHVSLDRLHELPPA